jgi:hypothetical protein
MGKVNQSTLTRSLEWAKHLRPFGKRAQARRERAAVKNDIRQRYEDFRELKPQ